MISARDTDFGRMRRGNVSIIASIQKIIPKIKNKTRKQKAKDLLRYVQNGKEFLRERFNLGTMEATNAYLTTSSAFNRLPRLLRQARLHKRRCCNFYDIADYSKIKIVSLFGSSSVFLPVKVTHTPLLLAND